MKPEPGEWYNRSGVGAFEVITVDKDADLLEIQFEDGTVETWPMDDWNEADEDDELIQLDGDPSLNGEDDDEEEEDYE